MVGPFWVAAQNHLPVDAMVGEVLLEPECCTVLHVAVALMLAAAWQEAIMRVSERTHTLSPFVQACRYYEIITAKTACKR